MSWRKYSLFTHKNGSLIINPLPRPKPRLVSKCFASVIRVLVKFSRIDFLSKDLKQNPIQFQSCFDNRLFVMSVYQMNPNANQLPHTSVCSQKILCRYGRSARPLFTETPSYWYRESHYKADAIIRLSLVYNKEYFYTCRAVSNLKKRLQTFKSICLCNWIYVIFFRNQMLLNGHNFKYDNYSTVIIQLFELDMFLVCNNYHAL